VYLNDGTMLTQSQIQAKYLASLTEEKRNYLFPYGVTDGFAIEIYDFVRAILKNIKPEMDAYDLNSSKQVAMT
jgi:hypothetical protein